MHLSFSVPLSRARRPILAALFSGLTALAGCGGGGGETVEPAMRDTAAADMNPADTGQEPTARALAAPTGTLTVTPYPTDLRQVEKLFRSNKYVVGVRRSGETSYQSPTVFETRNDWVLYDFFNDDLSKRNLVKRTATQLGFGKSDIATLAFTRFTFTNTSVEVKVSVPSGAPAIDNVTVRPLRLGIKPTISPDRRSLTFTLPQPQKVSVEINNRLNPLFVLTDAPDAPGPSGSYTHYFGPGVHRIDGPNGTLKLYSNESVYIAAGAIVEGRFLMATGSNNIRIAGRGILSRGEWNHTSADTGFLEENATFYSEGTSNFTLEGLTVVNSNAWQVALNDYSPGGNANVNNRYLNVNLLTWNGNTDAFWVTGKDTIVNNAFVFNNDDLVVSKGGSGARISNVVHWGGVWGRTLLLHALLNNMPEITDLDMTQIDTIGKEGGPTLIKFEQELDSIRRTPRNIRVRNFYVEERRRPGNTNNSTYNVHTFLALEDERRKGSYLTDLLFENVSLDVINNGLTHPEGFIRGTDQNRVTGITFRNFRRGGTRVTSPQDSGIEFTQTSAPVFQ